MMCGEKPAWNVRPLARPPKASRLALGAALLAMVAWGAPALATTPLVTAPDGTFRGKIDMTGAMLEFLGLRYAQPVTGSLRWKAPQPVTPSVVTQNATEFGSHCPQVFSPFGNATETEDCLFLNVFAPNRSVDGGADGNGARPVMVWIHGGGLAVGESDDFDPIKLVQRGVIVVTINYRLGTLGFLAHPALTAESPDRSSGNFGIQDQQAALSWVRRNIRAFGGDPERVTLFGESAGGLSTLTQLVSPTASGLFQRAIGQSGTYSLTQPTLEQAEAAGTAFAKSVGCDQPSPDDVLECLRSLSVPTILANQAVSFVGALPLPNVDGTVLTQSIAPALASGRFNRVPLMNGTNRDEYNLFIALYHDLDDGPITASTYDTAIAAATGVTPMQVARVTDRYQVPGQFPSFDEAAGAAATDAEDACSARFVDALASQFVPTFAYEFSDRRSPQNFLPAATFPYGAAHTTEIQYLFPTANPSGVGLNLAQTALDADQEALSDQMVGYWTAFARSGDPAGSAPSPWPRFHRDRQVWLSLAPPAPATETNFATIHQCDFWDSLAGRSVMPADVAGKADAANND